MKPAALSVRRPCAGSDGSVLGPQRVSVSDAGMKIDYDHSKNVHGTEGPRIAFKKLFPEGLPASLLDVGCGTGIWLRAALECGVTDILGLDGVDIQSDQVLIPSDCFRIENFTKPIDLGRRFSAIICLEVAEHLEERYADILLDTLARHSDRIIFSAACPGQPGQHHVNCQWPAWWQKRFNDRGYYCDDELRWRLWDDSILEPWYRQNAFVARREADRAGREPRLKAVIHPEMVPHVTVALHSSGAFMNSLANGAMPLSQSARALSRGIAAKIRRKVSRALDSRTWNTSQR